MNAKNVETTKNDKVSGLRVVENECIWMRAGVVNFRICDNAYSCYSCPFDKAMRKAMEQSDKVRPRWSQAMKERFAGSERPCRHALTGRIEGPKICTMNYECFHCPFDQMLDEMELAQSAEGSPSYRTVSGFIMAEDYHYHAGHSWVHFEHGGRARVGLDDFLARVFGNIQKLELPPLGAELKQNQVGWAFQRNDHRADVLSPSSGKVLALNHAAFEHPEIACEDPYRTGWLLIMEPAYPKRDVKKLHQGEKGFRWMEEENKKLLGFMGSDYDRMAATGGRAVQDIYGRFPGLDWNQLVHEFLHT